MQPESFLHASLKVWHLFTCFEGDSVGFADAFIGQFLDLISQPLLTQASIAPSLLPRLLEEWRAWIARIDDMVNREGGMFGRETVRSWERTLDGIADGKLALEMAILANIRDVWVSKVGWVVGRTIQQPMDV